MIEPQNIQPRTPIERPILFDSAMVCAILAGRKTQTRRIVKPHLIGESRIPPHGPVLWVHEDYNVPIDSPDALDMCPFGQPGDRLWVRETWTDACSYNGARHYTYRATDHEIHQDFKWKPSIHMPRLASRITLEVTDVRVQRLRHISGGDAVAEGYPHRDPGTFDVGQMAHAYQAAIDWYKTLWESMNCPGSWAANPWVWAVDFRLVNT